MRWPAAKTNQCNLFRGQDFVRLKRECKRNGSLFVDPEFPPTNVSLFLDTDRSADVVWKRPGDLVDDPQLFVEGASPFDTIQGVLGNCWFVSACSALTHNEALIQKVIPNAAAQEWGSDYCGIFEFCFWRFGTWIRVVIDDLLPTKDGKLLFARSKTNNEFWSALLEKAFAKLYGCYENLVGGQLADALQDVSGGVAETINVSKFLAEDPLHTLTDLFQLLRIAFEQQALIVSAIKPKNKEDIETSLDCGLIVGHAYAVTAVRYIELDAKKSDPSEHELTRTDSKKLFPTHLRKMMIRLQNPWGEKEWNGPWSDNSVEWEMVTEAQKRLLGITIDEDGDFWMPWDEFVAYFTDISICQLFNTTACCSQDIPNHARPPHYHEFITFDSWSTHGVKSGAPGFAADRSGGCQNFPATFCFNPQYKFDIDSAGGEVMIALTQKEISPEAGKQREPFISIGLHVMKVECNRQHRIHQAINPIATSDYVGTRSVYVHLQNLRAGRYIIMPTTFAPREQTDFMLRIYSPDNIRTKLLKRDRPTKTFPLFQCSRPRAITRIHILEAYSNEFQLKHMCAAVVFGRHRFYTPLCYTEDFMTNFDEMFVFHSESLQQKFMIEIYYSTSNGGLKLRAKAGLNIMTDNDSVKHELKLKAVGSDPAGFVGTLNLSVYSYDDLFYI
ncbi:Calpain-5 [Aphelenchoides bicaudatus]|nr:Calpain-5 [Aphelenchoides bicaudatus]